MTKRQTLRIGKISYANLFPLFYMLEREADCSAYEIMGGVPSDLNKKIRQGLIDVSPSSSIEYLRNEALYDFIPNHSISSSGPVGSILLFSKRPIEELGGETILTTSHSETSVALLRIILSKFYAADCPLKSSSEPIEEAMRYHEACLLIGDEAMRQALRWPQLFVYDLGGLWFSHTGLPSSFALWIIRKDCLQNKADLLERFISDLAKAKSSAMKNLREIAAASPLRHLLSEEELISYWQGISYDFGEEHRKGFELFRTYAQELGLLETTSA